MMQKKCDRFVANRSIQKFNRLLPRTDACKSGAGRFSKIDFSKFTLLTAALLLVAHSAAVTVAAQAVTSFTLVNADTNGSIAPLTNNATVNLANLPTGNLNICAGLTGTFGSVKLSATSSNGANLSTTQNITPYCFDPNSETDIGVMSPALAPGTYTVKATPYSGIRGTGTAGTSLTVAFHVLSETAPPPAATHPASDQEAARFLARVSFGATQTDITRLKTIGYEAWINEQLSKTPGSCFNFLNPLVMSDPTRPDTDSNGNPVYDKYKKDDAQHCIWREAVTGSAQLRQRMTLALSEIFVISTQNNTIGDNMPRSAVAYWDILNRNAFGSYRQLLQDVTLSPAMGTYLSHRQNRKENLATGREPDENYAREVMQLFSIGLYQLNQNGTRKLANGQSLPTYTIDDIKGLARVFTGLTWADDTRPTFNYTMGRPTDPAAILQPMKFNLNEHSISEKKFLGVTIPARSTPEGTNELKTALDAISNHPSVGPFMAERLIQMFVTSNPTRGYVSRVAAVFNNNGSGVRGNLGRVIKAVLLDPEALNAINVDNPRWGKGRQSTLRKTNLMRLFKYRTNTDRVFFYSDSKQGSEAMQNVPLSAPSVFNFYRPGFAPPGSDLETANLVAPELQILNESTLTAWGNWLLNKFYNNSMLYSTDLAKYPEAVFDYSSFTPLANDAPALVGKFELLLATELSAANKQRIIDAVNKVNYPSSDPDQLRLNKIKLAAFLVMVTPEYFVQK